MLVVGAGSGMGSAAVRLASALGARVIATSGTDGKGARLREIGADEVINYRTTPDFPGAVLEITGGREWTSCTTPPVAPRSRSPSTRSGMAGG